MRPGPPKTPEEKAKRIRRYLQLRKDDTPYNLARKRVGSDPNNLKKWAAELGIPWTDKTTR
jgi:hypothetical protein